MTHIYLGIDFGTSGARAIAIDSTQQIQAQTSIQFDDRSSQDLASLWKSTLFSLLEQLPVPLRREMRAIAINGTSSTVLLCDANGDPVDQPILYNDDRGAAVLDTLRTFAPPDHPVVSATSSLAKLLWWVTQTESAASTTSYFLHQADWLAFWLHGRLGVSDYHNALKLGYDVGQLCYPEWLETLPLTVQLPQVVVPGTPVGMVQQEVGDRFNLPSDCMICAGTTDSIAAFLASGANCPGDAVTSLGSTLVVKLLSQTRVDAAQYGIYSHRLDDVWLVGGASNTGGAVLKQFFNAEQLEQLSAQIDPTQESLLNYYPLLKPGERFPVNDPHLQPQLEPRPQESVVFLHGLLESIARIEAQGYRLLQELGATSLSRVYTAGGGAANSTWTAIRQRYLGVPLTRSEQTEAAYGTALLALSGTKQSELPS